MKKELLRIYIDENKKLHCDVAYEMTDYQVVGLLDIFKNTYLSNFVKGATYEPHFHIGDFDADLKVKE